MLLKSILIATILAIGAHANIRAWSGSNCDGNAGLSVPCDGSCHQFNGRHSFRVDGGTGNHCVTMFIDAGCPAGARDRMFTFTGENGQCQNVNTGTGISSFICSNSNVCLV